MAENLYATYIFWQVRFISFFLTRRASWIKHTHTHTHTHIRNLAAHPGANTTQRICTVPTYSCWQKRRISFFCPEGLYALDAAGQKQNNVNMNEKIKTRVKTQITRSKRKYKRKGCAHLSQGNTYDREYARHLHFLERGTFF